VSKTRKLSRRAFLYTATAGSAAYALGRAGSAPAAEAARPNIVVMVADDAAWNDLGCYGHPHIKTPNLDRLAQGGVRFEGAFLTCSSCSPSRCSVLTGRYPHSTGAAELHQPLPEDQVTIAAMLRDAGYYTAAVGKWHLGEAAKKDFEHIQSSGVGGHEKWRDALRARPKDRPFFFWLAANDPHRPYQADTIPNPHRPSDAVVPPFLPDVPDVRKDLAMYYDEIARLDGAVGGVMELLQEEGLADNTIVVFFSDNGRPFPRCKTTVYDSGVKTPLLIRWPNRIQPGTVSQALVSTVDLAPTLLEAAELSLSPTFQGRPFCHLFGSPESAHRKYVYAEHNWHDFQAHERAVRSQRYLYIRNAFPELTASPPADAVRSMTFRAMQQLHEEGKLPPSQSGCFVAPRPAEELYDVAADPFSLVNLAGDAKHKAALEEMREAFEAWVRETNDSVPENPTPDRFDRQTGERLDKKNR